MKFGKAALTKTTAVLIAVIVIVALIVGVSVYYFAIRPEEEYIHVGASIALSGVHGFNGEQMKAGYEFAIEDINNEGGIYVKDLGRKLPVKFTYYDDESDSTKAKTNAERLITIDKVDFLLGSFGTPNAVAIATVAEEHETIHIASASAVTIFEKQHFNWTFLPFNKDHDYVEAVFTLLNEKVTGPIKIALWEEDTTLGTEFATDVLELATKYSTKYTIVFHDKYTPGQLDYSTMILRTKETNPDVVFAIPSTADGITLIRQSKEVGLSPKLWYVQRAADTIEFWQGTQAQGAIQAESGTTGLPFTKNQEIVQRYQQKFGKPPSVVVLYGYTNFLTLVTAIEKAGSLDKYKVRDALCTLEIDAPIGKITFNGPGHAYVRPLITQWQDGTKKIVWPADLANANFLYPA